MIRGVAHKEDCRRVTLENEFERVFSWRSDENPREKVDIGSTEEFIILTNYFVIFK
jgi:hypothetical protein